MLRNDLTMPTTVPKVPKEDATLGTNVIVSEALESNTTEGLKLCCSMLQGLLLQELNLRGVTRWRLEHR